MFKYPGDQGQGVNRTDYIKRIVGMPGDRIQVTNGLLHINGVAVDRLKVGDHVKGTNGSYQKGTLYSETLPNGRRYTVLEYRDDGNGRTTRRSSSSRRTATSSWATIATIRSTVERG